MKKITPYILIFFILVNLFAPVSLELRNNKINVNENKTEADSPQLKGYITKTDTTITVYAAVNFETPSWRSGNEKAVVIISDSAHKLISFKATNGDTVNATVMETHNINDGIAVLPTEVKTAISDNTTTVYYKKVFTGLTPSTIYNVSIYATHSVLSWWTITGTAVAITSIILTAGASAPLVIAVGTSIAAGTTYAVAQSVVNVNNDANTVIMDPQVPNGPPEISVTTNVAGDSQNTVASNNITGGTTPGGNMPACSMLPDNPLTDGTPMGCLAQGIYYVLFQPTSYLFALAGTLFDDAFAYSVNDNSYRSDFVTQGWKVVRDFCNIFFIFILLYVAFGTILNLNGVKTKEMIINIVLIGIFINFSLFAAEVIIDASNILARVFYNSNTITVKMEDSAVGSSVIPLSSALVNKINPQQIILNANKVDMTEDTRGKGVAATGTTAAAGISAGTFILVTILATLVNLVGVFVFFSVAIIFVGRVIGLWLAMIFVPFAFLSYTVPAMQNFEMVGWKKWWPDTLKMAFLAPVFIFFLYLILQFLSTGLGLIKTDTTTTGLSFMVGIILPFAFIMILLLKAKSIATDMSGKIGEAFSKAGAAVGGLAVGAAGGFALGGIASLGRATVGKVGDNMANSEWAKTHGAVGRGVQNLGKWTSGQSFDARATKLGASAQKNMGVDFGKSKQGGYAKFKVDHIAKKNKIAKGLEVGENAQLTQDLHKKEEDLKMLKNKNALKILELDGYIKAGSEASQIKNRRAMGLTAIANEKDATKEDKERAKEAREEAKNSENDLKKDMDRRAAIRTGGETGESYKDGTSIYNTTNGNITKKEVDDLVDEATKSKKIAEDANTEFETTRTAAEAKTKAALADAKTTTKMVEDKFGSISPEAIAARKVEATTIKTIGDDEANAIADAENKKIAAISKAGKDQEAATKAVAAKEHALATGGYGRSINNLDFIDIPTAKHAISEENSKRKNKYADVTENRWFNKKINKSAAHDIRMEAEIKPEVKEN